MASGIKKENVERGDTTSKTGHYKAYDRQGTIIWEDKEFVIGKSQVSSGLSIVMRAAQIMNGKEELHRWDPDNMLP